MYIFDLNFDCFKSTQYSVIRKNYCLKETYFFGFELLKGKMKEKKIQL